MYIKNLYTYLKESQKIEVVLTFKEIEKILIVIHLIYLILLIPIRLGDPTIMITHKQYHG